MTDMVCLNSMRIHDFQGAKKTIFGAGAVDRTGLEARRLDAENGLIVTDTTIERTGLIERIKRLLEDEGLRIDVFNGIEPEPSLEIADSTAKISRKGDYGFIVGVGGGSVLDMAKIASVAITNPGNICRYVGFDKIENEGVPKILIPTTAGTGSEVTNIAVVTLMDNKRKSSIVDAELLSDVAIVDPLTTMTLPTKTTAAAGIDALSHAIESMMSKESSVITDLLALEATKMIGKSLKVACCCPDNLEARYNMSVAALMAGLSFGNAGLSAGHAAAHAYGMKHGISHGVSCAIALPYVMEYNLPVCREKFALIASVLGEETTGLEVKDAATRAIVAVRRLIADLELPANLRSMNVPERDIEKLAEDMLRSERMIERQPRKMTIQDAARLLQRIYGAESVSSYSDM